MYTYIVITVVSDDKPGIVKFIAQHVTAHDGEWLESKLANLAGKFVGVVKARISERSLPMLKNALAGADTGVTITIETLNKTEQKVSHGRLAGFHVLGPDRNGIVEEISHALLTYNLNVEEIETRLTSEPYSGTPLFDMQGVVRIPENTDIDGLNDSLNKIADLLGVDISIPEFSIH